MLNAEIICGGTLVITRRYMDSDLMKGGSGLRVSRGYQIRARSKTKKERCCFGCTGSRNQGSHFDSHHGEPLWGGHAGHSSGICKDLWEISIHSHICECTCNHPSNYALHFLRIENDRSIIIFVIKLMCIYRATLPGIIRNYCWSSVVEAIRRYRWSATLRGHEATPHFIHILRLTLLHICMFYCTQCKGTCVLYLYVPSML